MSGPLFSFTGLYGNMLNNGGSSANKTTPYPLNTQRAPIQARLIDQSGASVMAMAESAKSNWDAVIDPELKARDWVCTGPLTQTVAYRAAFWTLLETRTEQLSFGRQCHALRLQYGSDPDHWVWILASHLSAGIDATTYANRLVQVTERAAFVRSLGTPRWLLYSDDNEWFGRAEGDGSLVYQRDVAGWLHQYSPVFRSRIANNDYESLREGSHRDTSLQYRPSVKNIDLIWTDSGDADRIPRTVSHHSGSMVFTTTDPTDTVVVPQTSGAKTVPRYASDHNWHRLVSGVYA